MNQAYRDGYNFGKAFGLLFVVRSNEASKIFAVAQKFGKWEGYREIEAGMEYISGFADGLSSVNPKQLSASEDDAEQ